MILVIVEASVVPYQPFKWLCVNPCYAEPKQMAFGYTAEQAVQHQAYLKASQSWWLVACHKCSAGYLGHTYSGFVAPVMYCSL